MRPIRYAARFLAAGLVTVAVSAAARRPTTSPGMTYTARFTGLTLMRDGTLRPAAGPTEPNGFTAVVVWAAGRGRMEMLDGSQPGLFEPGDYFLFDSTEAIIVRAATKTFSRVPLEVSGTTPPRVSRRFANVKASVDSLGPGDLLGGYPTQHYRITTTAVMIAGFDGMQRTVDRRTTTDYWLADIANFPPPPPWYVPRGADRESG